MRSATSNTPFADKVFRSKLTTQMNSRLGSTVALNFLQIKFVVSFFFLSFVHFLLIIRNSVIFPSQITYRLTVEWMNSICVLPCEKSKRKHSVVDFGQRLMKLAFIYSPFTPDRREQHQTISTNIQPTATFYSIVLLYSVYKSFFTVFRQHA